MVTGKKPVTALCVALRSIVAGGRVEQPSGSAGEATRQRGFCGAGSAGEELAGTRGACPPAERLGEGGVRERTC